MFDKSPSLRENKTLEKPGETIELIKKWIILEQEIGEASAALKKSGIPGERYNRAEADIEAKSLRAQKIFDQIRQQKDLTEALGEKSNEINLRYRKAETPDEDAFAKEIDLFAKLKDKLALFDN